MSSKIPLGSQPLVTQTITTTTAGSTIDTMQYDYSVYAVQLTFAGATGSVAVIETSPDNITWTAITNHLTPAITGTAQFIFLTSSAIRYFRVHLTTVGGATLTALVLPIS